MDLAELVGPVGITGAIASGLTLAIQNFVQRRKLNAETEKTDAEAADVTVKTALALMAPLRERIQELEAEVEELRAKVRQTVAQLDACQDSNRAKDARIAALTR